MLNFMGIGAQKSGTTWLHNTLSGHSGIAFPGAKEVHFWDRPDGRSVDWYLQLFSDENRINGDITPAYAFLPQETIQKIYQAFPTLRLIYLIRNPVERAWSSARMALGRAEMLHEEASDQWFIDHFNSRGSLARGDYETSIRNWRSIYPSNQLLIIRYETIGNDPVEVANTCLKHIGLESFFLEQDRPRLTQRVFEGDGIVLRPALRSALSAIYAPRLESLMRYLNEDFSSWNV